MTDKKIKAVIFDFDGTLYDSKGTTFSILSRLSIFGILLAGKERKIRKQMKGLSFQNQDEFEKVFFERISEITKFKKSAEKIKKWFYKKYMKAFVRALKSKKRVRSSVIPLFEELRKLGIKTAVFSDYPLVKERMEAIELPFDSVDFIMDSYELGGLKPCKDSFIRAAEKIGVNAENCLMVGDREETDGDGSRSSGMEFILVQSPIADQILSSIPARLQSSL